MRRTTSSLLTMITVIAACSDGGTGPEGPAGPASIIVTAGDGQVTKATQNFSQQIAVKVLDAVAKPVAGVNVAFQVTAGTATVTPSTALTDAEGVARASVTAGTTPGAVSITARADRVAAPVTFSLNVTPLAVAIAVVSGNSQSIAPAQAFAQPLVVKVADDAGNGVAGIRVTFEAAGSAATLNPAEATSDAQGLARTTVTAGGSSGTVTINARAAFISTPAVFTLTIASPIDGMWRGTTSQNNPILLRVNGQRSLDSLSVRVSFSIGTSTCTITMNSAVANPITGSAFDFTYAVNGTLNLRLTGTFSPTNTLAGDLRVIAPTGAFICGSLLVFGGSGSTTLTTRTYTAAKS